MEEKLNYEQEKILKLLSDDENFEVFLCTGGYVIMSNWLLGAQVVMKVENLDLESLVNYGYCDKYLDLTSIGFKKGFELRKKDLEDKLKLCEEGWDFANPDIKFLFSKKEKEKFIKMYGISEKEFNENKNFEMKEG